MELEMAKGLCEVLMTEKELGKKWKFGWLNAKRTYGKCNWQKKYILLSKKFVLANEMPEVRDVILHEIAHAKCHKHGHNKYWKAWCLKLGAKPYRFNSTANKPI